MSEEKREETAAREEQHGLRFEAMMMDKKFKMLWRSIGRLKPHLWSNEGHNAD